MNNLDPLPAPYFWGDVGKIKMTLQYIKLYHHVVVLWFRKLELPLRLTC